MALFKKNQKGGKVAIEIVEGKNEPRTAKVPVSPHSTSLRASAKSNTRQVLLRSHIAEKSVKGGADRQYAFIVSSRANKPEIKKAVEKVYQVHVTKVNIVNTKRKPKFWRGKVNKTATLKKATVTLAPGEKLEIS